LSYLLVKNGKRLIEYNIINLSFEQDEPSHSKPIMSNLKVLFLAAEAEPLAKVGGLGDVAGSLPQALHKAGDIDVRLAIPYHSAIQERRYPFKTVAAVDVPHHSGPIPAKIVTTHINDVIVYLVSGDPIPSGAPVYSSDGLLDGYKFTFFSLAALQLTQAIQWTPDIIHANDWHTAPALYALEVHRNPQFAHTAALLGLHNLPYMGVGAGPAMLGFGLPPASGSSLPWWAQDMPLPLGMLAANHIVAASPSYASEILTPEYGLGLEDFLQSQKRKISGILNGLDVEKWNPETDKALAARFNSSCLPGRLANKAALLTEIGFAGDPDIPLLGVVSRLDTQKGIDLIPDALRGIADLPWRIVLLATGDPAIEAALRRLEAEFPDRVCALLRFDSALSHRIYAGVDVLLIPSRYEPCGLTQMIAMRYGCVPVARSTGGLRDTIQDFGASPESTGFLFEKAHPDDLASALRRCIELFERREDWLALQERGMAQDFSWERSARQYLALYKKLAAERRRRRAPARRPAGETRDG
jgi:starch synthase